MTSLHPTTEPTAGVSRCFTWLASLTAERGNRRIGDAIRRVLT